MWRGVKKTTVVKAKNKTNEKTKERKKGEQKEDNREMYRKKGANLSRRATRG